MEVREGSSIEGEAAFKTIKSLFPKLTQAVIRGQIPESLYAASLIDDETFEIFMNTTQASHHKGRVIVRQLQSSVRLTSDAFSNIVDILRNEDVCNEVATSAEGTCIAIRLYDLWLPSPSFFGTIPMQSLFFRHDTQSLFALREARGTRACMDSRLDFTGQCAYRAFSSHDLL